MRLLWLFLALMVAFTIPFLIWGGSIEAAFSQERTVEWLGGFGRWAWAAGFALLASDLLLPIPGTVVMSAFGFVYGPVLGGLLSAAGSFLSGALAYWLCRALGRGAAWRILGERDLMRGEALFANVGGWLVVLSRWLPLFPEVVACMAGLTRMPVRAFHLALACGAVPLGFAFAAVGHAGVEHPTFALLASALAPPALWLVVQPLFRARVRGEP